MLFVDYNKLFWEKNNYYLSECINYTTKCIVDPIIYSFTRFFLYKNQLTRPLLFSSPQEKLLLGKEFFTFLQLYAVAFFFFKKKVNNKSIDWVIVKISIIILFWVFNNNLTQLHESQYLTSWVIIL
jgi:hypothetical protein